MQEVIIFVQKAYDLSTPHLKRSSTPKGICMCMRAYVGAFVCVCAKMRMSV